MTVAAAGMPTNAIIANKIEAVPVAPIIEYRLSRSIWFASLRWGKGPAAKTNRLASMFWPPGRFCQPPEMQIVRPAGRFFDRAEHEEGQQGRHEG